MTRSADQSPVLLLVEGDIVVRHPLAEYLRECGFTVFEAANDVEALDALRAPHVEVSIVLADMATFSGGFALRRFVKDNFHDIDVVLTGSLEKTVGTAGKLCQEGSAKSLPYRHHAVLEHIRELLARRDRAKQP